jgi:hypothetical protein
MVLSDTGVINMSASELCSIPMCSVALEELHARPVGGNESLEEG